MCLRDDRREERVIVSPAAFKEINIIFFFIWAPAMGMSVLAHLFCRISSGGEDIVLSMLLKERRYKFSSFFGRFGTLHFAGYRQEHLTQRSMEELVAWSGVGVIFYCACG